MARRSKLGFKDTLVVADLHRNTLDYVEIPHAVLAELWPRLERRLVSGQSSPDQSRPETPPILEPWRNRMTKYTLTLFEEGHEEPFSNWVAMSSAENDGMFCRRFDDTSRGFLARGISRVIMSASNARKIQPHPDIDEAGKMVVGKFWPHFRFVVSLLVTVDES